MMQDLERSCCGGGQFSCAFQIYFPFQCHKTAAEGFDFAVEHHGIAHADGANERGGQADGGQYIGVCVVMAEPPKEVSNPVMMMPP